MERRFRTCDNCEGSGKITTFESVSMSEGTCTLKTNEITCTNCSGRGWIEYAVFSVEEAEAILKHCGLPVENN